MIGLYGHVSDAAHTVASSLAGEGAPLANFKLHCANSTGPAGSACDELIGTYQFNYNKFRRCHTYPRQLLSELDKKAVSHVFAGSRTEGLVDGLPMIPGLTITHSTKVACGQLAQHHFAGMGRATSDQTMAWDCSLCEAPAIATGSGDHCAIAMDSDVQQQPRAPFQPAY